MEPTNIKHPSWLQRPNLRRSALIGLAFVTLFIGGAGVGQIEVSYTVREKLLHAAFDTIEHIPDSFLDRMDSGLTATLLTSVHLLKLKLDDSHDQDPLSIYQVRCKIRYDPWAEEYSTLVVEEGSAEERYVSANRRDALLTCTTPRWIPILSTTGPEVEHRYILRVALNADPDRPTSRAKTKDHIGNPGSVSADRSGGRSIFGTVARALFREHDDTSDTAVLLHSRPFGEALIRQALLAAEKIADEERNPQEQTELEEE